MDSTEADYQLSDRDREKLSDLMELRNANMSDRDIAFQVWATLGQQSPSRTVAILEDQYGIEIKHSTVRVWSSRHNWNGRLRELLYDIAPTELDRAALQLVVGVADAASYLVAAARGDAEPNRDRINAAIGVLDRVGFLPHTRKEASKTGLNAVTASAELPEMAMSDEELEELMRGRTAIGDMKPLPADVVIDG